MSCVPCCLISIPVGLGRGSGHEGSFLQAALAGRSTRPQWTQPPAAGRSPVIHTAFLPTQTLPEKALQLRKGAKLLQGQWLEEAWQRGDMTLLLEGKLHSQIDQLRLAVTEI